jgi:predicted transcriptional regulator
MVDVGPLEMRVLGLLDGREPQSVADLRARLGGEHAYTTVMTVLTRLHKKGLVAREKDGARFLYSPASKAPKLKGGILARVRRALFPDGDARPLLALLEEEQLSQDDLRALREVIDRRLETAEPEATERRRR